MRIALLSCLVLSGCLSVGLVLARPSLEVDGRHRAIHVTLGPEVPDRFALRSDNPMAVGSVEVSQWRKSVGQALVEGLSETLVVVDEAGPDVLELDVRQAAPTLLAVQGPPSMISSQGAVLSAPSTLFTQIDYRALLKSPEGEVLARAAGVAKGPIPGTSLTSASRFQRPGSGGWAGQSAGRSSAPAARWAAPPGPGCHRTSWVLPSR